MLSAGSRRAELAPDFRADALRSSRRSHASGDGIVAPRMKIAEQEKCDGRRGERHENEESSREPCAATSPQPVSVREDTPVAGGRQLESAKLRLSVGERYQSTSSAVAGQDW